jgi:hypothetical protein
MHRRQRPLARRFVIIVAVACFAFAQTAAAAYACARLAMSSTTWLGALVETQTPCSMHVASAEGDQTPSAPSNLCEVHCQTPSMPDAGPDIGAPAAIVAMHPVAAVLFDTTTLAARPPVPRSAAPPPALLTMRLLI